MFVFWSCFVRENSVLFRNLPGFHKISILLLVAISALYILPHKCSANPIGSGDSETSLRVSDMSFSEKLENPCALVQSTGATLRKPTESSEDKAAMQTEVLTELRAKTILLRDNVESILKTNMFEECGMLNFRSVAIIPSLNESETTAEEYFRLFYTSLLNHTAHVYFISHQLNRHTSDTSCNDNNLNSSARALASHMRELMCVLRFCIKAFQEDNDESESSDDSDFSDPTAQILNEQLVDQPLCSRRSFRDCQTIRSTLDLLRTLTIYLQRTLTTESS